VILQRRRGNRKPEGIVSVRSERLLVDFGFDGRFGFESGKQFAHGTWVEDGAGEAVLACFAGFLENVDILLAERRGGMDSVVLVR